MANPRAYLNGQKTQFSGNKAVKAGKKGAEKSAQVRRAKRDCLNVCALALEETDPEELRDAIETIKRFGKRGSLPHWQEWLRLIGQADGTALTADKTSFTDDKEIDSYAD